MARAERLREAALEVVRAQEAVRQAINGFGHEGEEHDQVLHFHGLCTPEYEVLDSVGDCAACGGAQYGTEDDLNRAYGRLRAALSLEVRPWEYPEEAAS